jgi:hypothetical protein
MGKQAIVCGVVLALSLCAWPVAAQEKEKKDKEPPSVQDALKAHHRLLQSSKKEDQVKGLREFLFTKKDLDVLYPKDAERFWKAIQEHYKMIDEQREEIMKEFANRGKIKKIEVVNVRTMDGKKSYEKALATLPASVPLVYLDVEDERGGYRVDAVYVNGRWVFLPSGIENLPEKLTKGAGGK